MRHPLGTITPTRSFVIIVAFAVIGCGGNSASSRSDTTSGAGSVAQAPDASSSSMGTVRGTVSTLSGNDLTVQSDNGAVHVQLAPSARVFDRRPSTLARVTPNTFIGVTTVKQPDGAERATEIHIFPEALRGLGEGSRPMTEPSGAPSGNTMTNGSTMTNGAAANGQSPGSTMSNGSVQSTVGSTLVVQYKGGSKTVIVPPTTQITEIIESSRHLAVGDRVAVVTTRSSDGSLNSDRVLLMTK
jgi:hypothetical protein